MQTLDITINEELLIEVLGNVTSPLVVLSELIKNGVDADAKSVTIFIDTIKNSIKIVDNGDGFTEADINRLGIAASSNKKRENFLYNSSGKMLLGSKGLAFFSVFSLGDKIEVRTKNKDGECYIIKWSKEDNQLMYDQVYNEEYVKGTEIMICGVESNDLLLLSSEKELNKLKHISLINFKRNIIIPKVVIFVDNIPFDISVENIENFSGDFDAMVTFIYDESTNTLKYSYEVNDDRITSKEIEIDLNDKVDAKNILRDVYKIMPAAITFDDFLTKGLIEKREISVPSFEGKWYMKRGRKNNIMQRFESGIRIYVNNFALYNYLNKNNDWLQLTNVSQVKKINNFRQNNVFGYVSFDQFNDLAEGMKISNERGGFIENINFNKFIDIIYTYVLYITIGIDVARKNNSFLYEASNGRGASNEGASGQGASDQGASGQGASGQGASGQGASGQGASGQGASGQGASGQGASGQGASGQGASGQGASGQGASGQGASGQGASGQGASGQGASGQGASGQAEDDQGDESSLEIDEILKVKKIKVRSGEQVYLLDPTIIRSEYIDNLKIVPRKNTSITDNVFLLTNSYGEYIIDYFSEDKKDTLTIKVEKRKVTGLDHVEVDFFESSIHFLGDFDLSEISDLVRQLNGLEYNEKYLLYVISFRAILEDIVKKYISRRSLVLSGKFKENITLMISDIQNVLTIIKNDPLKSEKIKIQQIFKGNDSLNNFLVGVNIKFSNENYEKLLHSLTHNPAKIDKSLALEIANDIILPIYWLSKLLKDNGFR
ncbi:ATP-binding protein [Paenibacillus sp. 2TAF8]|uniref:ATP-binding protein n=1 Tax=Paenibacillus sp. 2TAF8 TaxID=3233020 RepID=UPI003F9CC448